MQNKTLIKPGCSVGKDKEYTKKTIEKYTFSIKDSNHNRQF